MDPPSSQKLSLFLSQCHILAVKHWDTSQNSSENILARAPVPKDRVSYNYNPEEVGFIAFSHDHLSGDKAGHSCRSICKRSSLEDPPSSIGGTEFNAGCQMILHAAQVGDILHT